MKALSLNGSWTLNVSGWDHKVNAAVPGIQYDDGCSLCPRFPDGRQICSPHHDPVDSRNADRQHQEQERAFPDDSLCYCIHIITSDIR